MERAYPTLVQLLGGAFHQDWPLESDSADEVLMTMLRETSAEHLRAGLRELNELLGRGLCEPQLRDAVLYEIGCHITLERERLDASAWLANVREAIRQRVRDMR